MNVFTKHEEVLVLQQKVFKTYCQLTKVNLHGSLKGYNNINYTCVVSIQDIEKWIEEDTFTATSKESTNSMTSSL